MSGLRQECAPERMSATLNLRVHDLRVHALASLDASGHFNSQRGTGSTYWIVPIDRQLILSDTGNQFDFPCVISLTKAFKFAKWSDPRGDGGKTARSPAGRRGEHGISRKPLRRKVGLFRRTCGAYARVLFSAREATGAAGTRLSLPPLSSRDHG